MHPLIYKKESALHRSFAHSSINQLKQAVFQKFENIWKLSSKRWGNTGPLQTAIYDLIFWVTDPKEGKSENSTTFVQTRPLSTCTLLKGSNNIAYTLAVSAIQLLAILERINGQISTIELKIMTA